MCGPGLAMRSGCLGRRKGKEIKVEAFIPRIEGGKVDCDWDSRRSCEYERPYLGSSKSMNSSVKQGY